MNYSNIQKYRDTVRIGLDIGSTTLKCAILDRDDNIIFRTYHRHGAQIASQAAHLLRKIRDLLGGRRALLAVSRSA